MNTMVQTDRKLSRYGHFKLGLKKKIPRFACAELTVLGGHGLYRAWAAEVSGARAPPIRPRYLDATKHQCWAMAEISLC